MELRFEQEDDVHVIRALTDAAFEKMPFSNQNESAIIDALRNENGLTISLVAVKSTKVVGHIAFSPVTINGVQDDWYGLGPVSVWPEHQTQGIGRTLINNGLEKLKGLGAKGCVVLGDPDYYKQFGFACDPGLQFLSAPAAYFQRLAFVHPVPAGEVRYHPAFDGE